MTVKIIVHRFRLGDVDDPEIYAAEPIWQWEQSEVGRWVKEHAVEVPSWQIRVHHETYSHEGIIRAEFTEEDATFYSLKWGHHGSNRSI